MKILSYRSTDPFNNRGPDGMPSISPTTNKSVVPFNNVTTIQDILDGRKNIKDLYPGTRGNWAPGQDVDHSYKDEGSEYKRRERDADILYNIFDRTSKEAQEWRVKVPGGFESFVSFELAIKKVRDKKLPFSYISRAAQVTSKEVNRVAVIADVMSKVFLVDSIQPSRAVKETGSAFCIAPGYFVTCAHVVQSYDKAAIPEDTSSFGQDAILKLVQNDRAYSAQLIDFDLKNDLAILKADISVDSLKIDGDINPGEDVVIIGSPHGYENNVSTGIVGGLDRQVYQFEGAPTYMFIDASVFPGSSGGPVIKLSSGEVVGMITLIVSSEGDYGLNAALPASYIKNFCSQYIS